MNLAAWAQQLETVARDNAELHRRIRRLHAEVARQKARAEHWRHRATRKKRT